MIEDTELSRAAVYKHSAGLVEVGLITPKTITLEFADKPGRNSGSMATTSTRRRTSSGFRGAEARERGRGKGLRRAE